MIENVLENKSMIQKNEVHSDNDNTDVSGGSSDSYEAASESSVPGCDRSSNHKKKGEWIRLSEVLGKLSKGRIPDFETYD